MLENAVACGNVPVMKKPRENYPVPCDNCQHAPNEICQFQWEFRNWTNAFREGAPRNIKHVMVTCEYHLPKDMEVAE